jgi:C4-dicarboxylate transporter DctM subunit
VYGVYPPPLKTLIVIVIIYMLLGAFMDTLAMIILSVPIFFPIVSDLGYDPVWFGVLVVIVVELALITPPLGINVFVIKGMVKDVSLAQVFAGVLPFCVALILLIVLVIAVPDIVMFLPNLAG